MKKLFLILALAIAPIAANAGLWEKLSTMDQPIVKPTAQYLVEAAGWNVRVVEWVPAYNPNVRCMFVGGSKKGGATCYPIAPVR